MSEGAHILAAVKKLIPPLVHSSHKGQAGRIGIVGGSKEYTGAPYFAGISALYTGADLSHVICPEAAAPVIKAYSPELIVHPTLQSNITESKNWINRFHSIVVGPGLGLHENVQDAEQIIDYCRQQNKPLVIDADGLHVVTQNPKLILGYSSCILTPNVVEFARLYKKVFDNQSPSDDPQETARLSEKLGCVTILRKGPVDVISDSKFTIVCDHPGSPRRCGGQGDLLSGSMGVFLYWCLREQWIGPTSPTIAAAYAAACLTRKCSRSAFEKHGRGMVTSHMIQEIGSVFKGLFES